jgi:hypothetical protein
MHRAFDGDHGRSQFLLRPMSALSSDAEIRRRSETLRENQQPEVARMNATLKRLDA